MADLDLDELERLIAVAKETGQLGAHATATLAVLAAAPALFAAARERDRLRAEQADRLACLEAARREVEALRALHTTSVREAELLAEVGRLRAVIRTGGAMLRAERSALGVPGGVEPDELAALRAVAEAAKGVAAWTMHTDQSTRSGTLGILRAALRAWEERER